MDTIDSQNTPPWYGTATPVSVQFPSFLFVELVFLLIFLDDSLVGLLKVLG